jgi:hypothetical protein
MQSNKKTFRTTLYVGLVPVLVLASIVIFVIWGLSTKDSEKDYSVVDPEVIHDTVYVEKKCNLNHFECPPVEKPREKKKKFDTIIEIDSIQ